MIFIFFVSSITGTIFGLGLAYFLLIKKKDNLVKEIKELPYHARIVGDIVKMIKDF